MGVGAPAWENRYRRKLAATDVAVVLIAVFGAQLLRIGATPEDLSTPVSSTSIEVSYSLLSAMLVVGWLLMLTIGETRKTQNFGVGSSEYRRVVSSTLMAFGIFAVIAFALRMDIGRGYLLIALPTGLIALVLGRFLWRRRLHWQRRRGNNVYRTMLVGEAAKVRHVHTQMRADINAGFDVVVAATNDQHQVARNLEGVAARSYSDLLDTVGEFEVDTVIITGADDLSPERLQKLGWELDDRHVDLVVAAALTDVAGPRIHMRQAVGFPLIYVDYPKLTGYKRFVKRLFDVLGSLILILLLSPVMLIVALAVKLSSPGPIFYSQERVGFRGQTFPMFKFRSMVRNADDQLASLLDAQGTSDQPLHKVTNDPRITRVGRILRRFSLDELPQLFNVSIGTMSLVGPRPQRDAEVTLYDRHHHRRLLVKPGITGLWQVSGRSSLAWEDAIRLDLYYVENWSLVGDLVILWRTFRAVITADGAH
ncbi:Undecaprenyl-phosphate galactosephosphotransferase [Microbacterium esteraromaticum]|uniref:Undecaprenyl-phosphate galactosephosphotransferase n=1 Tax=Microbacterium esteraromaticum TaxID=57043 RepID=A0A1R4K9D7_9MICO|nr:sugar transferase [Microbacterium esteraromaticum]SJN40848.1 Undecaprenyl-phosphate galactosephosphotransferase [Microbacterium esteraromaticum]